VDQLHPRMLRGRGRLEGDLLSLGSRSPLARRQEVTSLLVILAILLVFNLLIFPAALARIGGKVLDLRIAYSPADAYAALTAYGDAGRHAYILTELTADFVYPLGYALFFWLLFRIVAPRAPRWVARLPFVVLVGDWLENAFILVLLARYPARADAVAMAASVSSTIKWILFASMVLLAVLLPLGTMYRRSAGPSLRSG
jgi:hypothetical protein